MQRTGAVVGMVMFMLMGFGLSAYGNEGTEMAAGGQAIWWLAPISAIIALGVAHMLYKKMMTASTGTPRMAEIAGYVQEGAMAYLGRQYKVVGVVFLVLAILFVVLSLLGIQDPFLPIAFVSGGIFSALSGYLGMRTATAASSRTAQGASESLNKGLQIAFRSGAVMGLVVVGLGLLFVSAWYLILDRWVYTAAAMAQGRTIFGMTLVPAGTSEIEKLVQITTTMITFGMGASTQALFARVGGGIYTKAADVGADLVGKVEANIPEDDPRNPGTIADNVGDNVGDVAGMGADLFESYCGSILATCALGAALAAQQQAVLTEAVKYVIAPMVVAGVGILLSIAGIFLVRCKEGASQKNLLKALLIGTGSTSALMLIASALMALGGLISWGIFGSITAGLITGVLIGQSTEYFTSDEYKPTRGIAEQAKMGAATTIIDGLATGMYSAGYPVLLIVVGILFAFGLPGGFNELGAGLYGIGFAAVGMLSTLGITLATDAYGPIADNAGGNAEMSELPPQVRERTDALDALGNTTAATGKGFAIGSAALTAMALMVAFIEVVKSWIARFAHEAPDGQFMGLQRETVLETEIVGFIEIFHIHLLNPLLLCGLFLGAMSAFVFCAMTMKAVGRAAGAVVNEVRRQFKEIKGIMDGSGKPDYAECVSIVTASAQREMVLPATLAIVIPVATGLILGVAGLVGLLAGALATGFVLATMLNNAGGAWDNAKKYIEKGNLGGKKLPDGGQNPVHAAAVIGDTVGDPCKDTSGPSLNILIKLMSMVAIVFAPLIVRYAPVIQEWLGLVPR